VGVSLAVAGVAALASREIPALVPFALAIAPAIIAIVLASWERGGALRRLLCTLITRPPSARWYLVLALPVLATLAVIPLAAALGGRTTGLFDDLLPAALIVPLVVLLPAFTEELAWRGFALPRVMTAMSPLRASLLLAVPWVVLHMVLYLPGQPYEHLAVWPAVLAVVSLSIIGTWIFVGTGGSVLLAGLFHAVFNGTTPLIAGVDPEVGWALRAVVIAVIALALIALGGFRRTSNPTGAA
jgi:membrane protease YdiL (CAAX protease family)